MVSLEKVDFWSSIFENFFVSYPLLSKIWIKEESQSNKYEERSSSSKAMNVKKLLGGTFSVLFAIIITILSWRFYVHFLNLYDVPRLITFCAIDFILDIIVFVAIAGVIIKNNEK